MKILLILAKKSREIAIKLFPSALFHMKTGVSLKYLVTDCRLIRICRIEWWCSLFCFPPEIPYWENLV